MMTKWKLYAVYITLMMFCFYVLLQVSIYSLFGVEIEPHEKFNGDAREEIDFFHEKHKYTGQSANHDQTEEEGYDESAFYHDFEIDRVVVGLKNRTDYAMKNNLPILMWWTPFTGEKGVIKRCSLGECFFTDSRKYKDYPNTKVFFFYGTDFNELNLPLPRKSHHEWALLHEESPKNSFLYSYDDVVTLFNHTCTFKQESDYPIFTQYLESIDNLLAPSNYTFEQKDSFGLAPIAYIQSGCNPPSDRDAYVNELMKYISIDSYGKCLHNKDIEPGLNNPLKMHELVHRNFLAKYKFVLAFENAICKDYITEKLWNPMYGGAVPIYKGAPNVLEWMPNDHAIILADNFASPKHLANFVKAVAQNKAAYEKYLEYKRVGVTNEKLFNHMNTRAWGINTLHKMGFITGFECFVCDRVHENRNRAKNGVRKKIHRAEVNHYGCPAPVLYPYDTPSGTNYYERTSWKEEFDDARKKAANIKSKVFPQ